MIVKHWKSPDFKAFVLEIPIYNTQILFFFGAKRQDLLRITKEVMNEGKYSALVGVVDMLKEAGHTLTNLNGERYIVVWMSHDVKSYEDEGTLAHEIFHAAVNTLKRCGLHLDESSEEAYAYLVGYITTHAYIGLAGNGFSDEPKKAKKSKKAKNEGTQHTLR